MKIKCKECHRIIEADEDDDYWEFTTHMVDFHFREILQHFGTEISD